MRYLLEIIKELPVQKEAADLNGDGIIDSLDLTLLRRYLLVYIDKFPWRKIKINKKAPGKLFPGAFLFKGCLIFFFNM